MLHELDTEMEGKGLRFVRFADDFSIYCKTKHQARKSGNEIYLFLKNKLNRTCLRIHSLHLRSSKHGALSDPFNTNHYRIKLPINRSKSGIRRPKDFRILGFGFVPTYRKGEKGNYQLVVESKKWKTLKNDLKEITRKTLPMSFDQRIRKLKDRQEGWINYAKHASISGKLKALDGWLRIKRSESRTPSKQTMVSKPFALLYLD